MTVPSIGSYVLHWLRWQYIHIEITKNKSLPYIEFIWLADSSIKESKERIRSCMKAIGVKIPPNKIVINLSPSWIRKSWSHLDLPIAVAVYMLSTESTTLPDINIKETIFLWEIGLDGTVKAIDGIIPMVLTAIQDWRKTCIIPSDNIWELQWLSGIRILGINHFSKVLTWVYETPSSKPNETPSIQSFFEWIQWHYDIKKQLCIAALWRHNVLMLWPPWWWKSVLWKAMKDFLWSLNEKERLETASIHSLLWIISQTGIVFWWRPFIEVDNTTTKTALLWWGRPLRPWLISKAHHWVLYFDEILDFSPSILHALKWPLEDRYVSLVRLNEAVQFPCDFSIVATANPCPCWRFGSEKRVCLCSQKQIIQYQKKLSGSFLDRIDMKIDVFSEDGSVIFWEKGDEDWESLYRRWVALQEQRGKDVDLFDSFDEKSTKLVTELSDHYRLSTRSMLKLAHISRTVADFDWKEKVLPENVAQAARYTKSRLLVA